MTIRSMDMCNLWLTFVDASIHLYNEQTVGTTYSTEFRNQKKNSECCEDDPGAPAEHSVR